GAERARYAGKSVLVVGAGHSAANALVDLGGVAGRLVWAMRAADPAESYGGGEADALAARGALGAALKRLATGGAVELRTAFRIEELREERGRLTVLTSDGRRIEGVDE